MPLVIIFLSGNWMLLKGAWALDIWPLSGPPSLQREKGAQRPMERWRGTINWNRIRPVWTLYALGCESFMTCSNGWEEPGVSFEKELVLLLEGEKCHVILSLCCSSSSFKWSGAQMLPSTKHSKKCWEQSASFLCCKQPPLACVHCHSRKGYKPGFPALVFKEVSDSAKFGHLQWLTSFQYKSKGIQLPSK